MSKVIWAAAVAAVSFAAPAAQAGLCGAGSYGVCPESATAANSGCYRTVREVVYDTKQIQCKKTVLDRVCEQVPVTRTRNVYETCYRDECYQVRKPVYNTCYRDVCYTVRKPVYKTCHRTVCRTVRKPVYKTCYRDVCRTVRKPVYKTCYREQCYTVRKPVYNTCYRDVCYHRA